MNLENISLADLKSKYQEILENGQIRQIETFIVETSQVFLEARNPKRLYEFCKLFDNQRKIKKITTFFQVIALIEMNMLTTQELSTLRNVYLDTSKKESISQYRKTLQKLQNLIDEESYLIKNEIALMNFFLDISQFNTRASESFNTKSFEVEKSWLIKQLILFNENHFVLSYIILALIHNGDSESAKHLYHYTLVKELPIDIRVKKWADKLTWNFSQNFEQKKEELAKTEILNFQNRKLPIDSMLKNVDLKEFQTSSANEKKQIEKQYQGHNPLDDSSNSFAKLFSQSISNEDDELKVNFLIENHFYKLAIELIQEKIEEYKASCIETRLKWYYLALFTYNLKQDYNKTIEYSESCKDFIDSLDHEQRIEVDYLKAEAYFYLGDYDKAKECFRKISNINSNYRLTKVRLEEINRFQ